MHPMQVLRVVVASPGDVQAERDTLSVVVEELNHGIAQDRGLRLELSRWETDAYPGFHPEGPQGLIDSILRIEDCDLLIGIFWKRFGTPVKDAQSGTEHEFRRAYEAWQQKRRPQIMVYFNRKAYAPRTKEETDQWGQVLELQQSFPKEGLWWPYKSKAQFEKLVRQHLTRFIREEIPNSSETRRASRGPAGATHSVSNPGSGGVAIGPGSVAAGQGGVAVGGDVHGNIYLGSPARDPVAALAIYRRVLLESSRHMSLRGLDIGASDPTGKQRRLDLTQVYVDLHTTTQVPLPDAQKERRKKREQSVEHETRPLGVPEAVAGHRRLVLLGDPGSGKSTFLAYLALCLAAHGADRQAGWLARLPGWSPQEADLVPIPVVLRDFAPWLPEGTKKAEPGHLWDFIVARLKAQNPAFAADPLHDRLEQGQAILLLDGLDEIPTPRLRTLIRDAVIACATRYPHAASSSPAARSPTRTRPGSL